MLQARQVQRHRAMEAARHHSMYYTQHQAASTYYTQQVLHTARTTRSIKQPARVAVRLCSRAWKFPDCYPSVVVVAAAAVPPAAAVRCPAAGFLAACPAVRAGAAARAGGGVSNGRQTEAAIAAAPLPHKPSSKSARRLAQNWGSCPRLRVVDHASEGSSLSLCNQPNNLAEGHTPL